MVSEIPYQVNRQRLLEKLGELVRDKKLPEISNIHDGADRHGIDIIIDLKSERHAAGGAQQAVQAHAAAGGLRRHHARRWWTACRACSRSRRCCTTTSSHQEEVIVRRTRYELAKAEERAHILEGYDHRTRQHRRGHPHHPLVGDRRGGRQAPDRALRPVEASQTDAILEMKLRRLTGLERSKIEDELEALREKIAYYKRVLSDDALVREIIKEELQEIKKKFGTPRKTRLSGDAKDIDVEDLIADENMVVTVTKAGYVKRLPVATYRQQKRGGKGMQGVNLKDNDYVEHLFVASTHAYMLFFSTAGKVYRLKVYELPEASAPRARHGHREPAAAGQGRDHFRRHRDEGLPVRRVPHVRHVARHGEEDVHGPVRPHAPRRPDRHQPEGRRRACISVQPRGAGREGHHGVERRQGHHVGRGRSARHGPRHHGRAGHERAAHRAGAGHGDSQARTRSLFRHHGEGLRQAHAHLRVSRASPRRSGRVHHHDDGEEGPVGRHEDRGTRRGDHDHVGGRRVRAYSRCPAFRSLARSTQGVRVMNVADNDRVTAVGVGAEAKKKKASGAQVEGEELDENAIDELEDGAEGTAEIESGVVGKKQRTRKATKSRKQPPA